MGPISEEQIRIRAYEIWEREGRPDGRDFEHWMQAKGELSAAQPGSLEPAGVAAPAPRGNGGMKAARKPSRSAAPRAARNKRPA